ncbi:hypothetical protein FQA47_024765 [Oryzias melastigma]|uniref:Myb/SANT-like DNA-binding domain-containing protein n=1 Tax=Oryzias melastigma TaxID=30732 RepID=A0A834CID8_ORYME|nr:hypothetical protein FQA47_024765 [Oryzias melastigma]
MLSQNKMHNWQENEIKELLLIRGSEAIRGQITGTVKDSVVYSRMTKLLAERGVHRTHMQVISKLKALRKQYLKYHDQKIRTGGGGRVHWLFYDLCHRAFDNSPMLSPSKRQRSPSPPPPATDATPSPSPPAAPPPPPAATANEVQVSLWEDEVDEQEIRQHLEAEDDEEEEFSPPEQLQTINTTYTAPSRKRRATVMDQVSTLVSATVAQLREMDAAMQAQEDARLQRLMNHEREMQNSLMSQLVLMNERISRENHERNLQLVDRILSRFPSSSSSH